MDRERMTKRTEGETESGGRGEEGEAGKRVRGEGRIKKTNLE